MECIYTTNSSDKLLIDSSEIHTNLSANLKYKLNMYNQFLIATGFAVLDSQIAREFQRTRLIPAMPVLYKAELDILKSFSRFQRNSIVNQPVYSTNHFIFLLCLLNVQYIELEIIRSSSISVSYLCRLF